MNKIFIFIGLSTEINKSSYFHWFVGENKGEGEAEEEEEEGGGREEGGGTGGGAGGRGAIYLEP